MFLPPKLTTIVFHSLAAVMIFAGSTEAQQAEFDRRISAMHQARARAQQAPPVRVASTDVGVDYAAPPSPTNGARTARATTTQARTPAPQNKRVVANRQQANTAPVRLAQASNRVANRFVPQHTRTAQLVDSTFIDGGSPIMGSASIGCADGSCGGGIVQGEVFDEGYSSCGSCGDAGCYFDECDSCCERGGCPPGPCWLSGLGVLFRNGEYFGGATAFRSTLFTPPVTNNTGLLNDCSHGYYGGFNFGIPLCKMTCGVLSGQFGARTVQSNFNGSELSPFSRDQVFVTAGLYRRVDYGLQFGVVADVLHEEWFTETDIMQIRADIGWVYPAGGTFGFRYTTNTRDDLSDGTVAGVPFTNMRTASEDQSRFYYRCDKPAGGYGEFFAGWTENEQTVIGLDIDMPLRERLAVQSGFTYYLNNDGLPRGANLLGGNAKEAFNIFVGLSLRPRGRSFYNSYDRPLFSVADNGSMLITRE